MSNLLNRLKDENKYKQELEKRKNKEKLRKQELLKIENDKKQKVLEQKKNQRDLNKKKLIKSGLCSKFLKYGEKIRQEQQKLGGKYFYIDGNESHFSARADRDKKKKHDYSDYSNKLEIDVDENGIYLTVETEQSRRTNSPYSYVCGSRIEHDAKYEFNTLYKRKIYIDPNNFNEKKIDICFEFILHYKNKLPFYW